MSDKIYDFTVKSIAGREVKLDEYKGKVVLIVNTASKCGFTPQYEGLNELFQKYREHDFVILGFPCNQFGAQEPGTNDEILSFCDINFKISFPMFSKIDVNGANEDPLFSFLKDQKPGLLGSKMIKWNFTKFLINKDGIPYKRYAPNDTPASIEKDIKGLLGI